MNNNIINERNGNKNERKTKRNYKSYCDVYWKQCNFLQEDTLDDEVEFYSRDKCKNISFKELLLWYIPQLGSWQDAPNCNECEKDYKCFECEEGIIDKKVKEKHYELFMELIDIYMFYNIQKISKQIQVNYKIK